MFHRLGCCLALFVASFAQAGDGLVLANPDFAAGLEGWSVEATHATIDAAPHADRAAARIVVAPDAPAGFPRLWQELPAAQGEIWTLAAQAAAQEVGGGYGAYLTAEFIGPDGRRIVFEQSSPAARGADFDALSVRAIAPAGTARVRCCLVLNGRGTALFTGVRMERAGQVNLAPPEGVVRLVAGDDIAVPALWGFGAEDDGWAYSQENTTRGVTVEDFALREARVAWMNPSWVRMFFWYQDWNPSGDWTTFDWDSDGMRSHYRSLDLYQRLGTAVTVTGVEWSVKEPWADPPALARAVGALMEHLIRDRGYTCIRHWILTNEPNTHFVRGPVTFETFVEIHRLVRAEFARRNLDIQILGSDDTNNGFPWFQQCVADADYYAASDAFASHRYFRVGSQPLAAWFFQERLDLLRARAAPAAPKPFVVAEFGFQDDRAEGALINPVMEDYDYALWTMAFQLDGVDRGVAGFNIWCLHEGYYPNGWRMKYGLWNFKDRDWSLRPVFHAAALWTRHARPGETAYRVRSTHPDHVRAVRVGRQILWVNLADRPVELDVQGFEASRLVAYTEDNLPSDTAMPPAESISSPRIRLPARAFGLLAGGATPGPG
jgi:hypothetical protein